MTDQTTPTISPNPDGDGVILHLPEITHVDTQVWSADVGLTAAGLAALRTLLAEPALQQPPVDRATLRDSVAHALEREDAINGGYDHGFCGKYGVDEETDGFVDAVLTVLPEPAGRAAELASARATNRRLNRRAQRLESELAAYRRAVSQWEISERGTYIPPASLRAIGRASGRDILGSVRHLKHFERVEQAEAEIERLRADRAAVLREAANIAESLRQFEPAFGPRKDAQISENIGIVRVADELRRMADEAQQTEPVRCPSCDHEAKYHDVDARCWFAVECGMPESNLVCPCAAREDAADGLRDGARRMAAGARKDGAQR
ncbi:hypothetical protein [Streptomyces sp. SID8499]|uniref:hypothetical protein n=1 Tax=Streptomyces sp. SID8499 TaxID=2706106 RepID=UPI0013CB3FC4|nr:hypothetical protein [Streptomyces sp. SID8499]NED31044.1 hypothetical protein [Streptomyces sp. SID8499]